MARYIFITGGVVSSLGKGLASAALGALLQARGYRPGVVSRGHGGSQREPLLLGAAPDPARVGDEPCLIHASIDAEQKVYPMVPPGAANRDMIGA